MSPTWMWILALVVMMAAPVGAEQMYRWKDASGGTHFSNVGPAGEEVVGEGDRREALQEESRAPVEGESTPAKVTASREKSKGPYGSLSDESFSTTASRSRGELQSRLRAAQRELRQIDSDLASYRRHREHAFEAHAAQLQGVSRPEAAHSDEEKKLLERKDELEKEIAGIRKQYDELREAAVERSGSVPGWWRPLD